MIDAKLKAVAQYFKDKVLEGDYVFVECGDCTAEILIDDVYAFKLWIANDPKTSFDFYSGFMSDDFLQRYFQFTTQKERLKGWRHIKQKVSDYQEHVLKVEKRNQYLKLKAELNID